MKTEKIAIKLTLIHLIILIVCNRKDVRKKIGLGKFLHFYYRVGVFLFLNLIDLGNSYSIVEYLFFSVYML